MKLPRRKFLHLVAGATALPSLSRIAWAQAYPSRPVTLIVFVGPGGAPDIRARIVAQSLRSIRFLPAIGSEISKPHPRGVSFVSPAHLGARRRYGHLTVLTGGK